MTNSTHKKIIAVDFDGTLCDSNYPLCGEPIIPVIDELLKEKEKWSNYNSLHYA